MERKRAGKKTAGISAKAMRDLGIKPYDVAQYLDIEAKRAAYFNAIVTQSGGDPAVILKALGGLARAGHGATPKDKGITRQGLHKASGESREPSLTNALKVFNVLGLQMAAKTAKAG